MREINRGTRMTEKKKKTLTTTKIKVIIKVMMTVVAEMIDQQAQVAPRYPKKETKTLELPI